MAEPIIPFVRIPVDPASVQRLNIGERITIGGIRQKTTVYVVTEPDIPGGRQTVVAITTPAHAKIELRLVE
jgi:hypothetical protein